MKRLGESHRISKRHREESVGIRVSRALGRWALLILAGGTEDTSVYHL